MIIDVLVQPAAGRDRQAACDRLADTAERLGIDRLVLMPAPGVADPDPAERVRAANDLTLAWVHRKPRLCLGFCALDSRLDPLRLEDELARRTAEGLRGVALESEAMGDDADLDRLADLAAERALPLALPAGAAACRLARRRPELTLIVQGLHRLGEQGLADVWDQPGVLVVATGGPPLAGFVDLAVRELGEQRVLFGSNAPRRDPAVQLEAVRGAYLTLRCERAVLGGNAARLLGLTETGR